VKTTLEAYRRHGEESRVMIMRDIQELTLQRVASLDARLAALERAVGGFTALMDEQERRLSNPFVGIHIAAVPRDRGLAVPRFARITDTFPYFLPVTIRKPNGNAYNVGVPTRALTHRRTLRGVVAEHSHSALTMRFSAMEDGRVDSLIIALGDDRKALLADWVLTLLANAVFTLHELRLLALAPEAEYAIAIRAATRRCPLELGGLGWQSPTLTPSSPIALNPLELPHYEFGPITEIHALHQLVLRDLYDAADDSRDATLLVEPPLDIRTRWEQAGTPLPPAN
jgi:hypothetical protein